MSKGKIYLELKMEKNTKVILIFFSLIVLLLVIMIYVSLPRQEKVNDIQIVEKGINPPKGNPDSEIVIIEFSDFQCPACKAGLPVIKEILEENDVGFYYRNFPIHKNSAIAAEAAECANEQGMFWEYHDVLFENQDKLDEESLKKYALDIQLDAEQFNSCFDSEKYKNTVLQDLSEGKSLGVRGTPTFFVNGKMVLGVDKEKIEKIIKDAGRNI